MSNVYYQDLRSAIVDFVKDAVIPNTKTVAIGSFQFLCPFRARVISEGVDVGCKTCLDAFGEFSELAGCPGREINTIGHREGL